MSFSKLLSSLYLVSFLLLVLLKAVSGDDPIYHICSSSGTFFTEDFYDGSLRRLSALQSSETPANKGFSLAMMGEVYGLALCRFDVVDVDCSSCVVDASKEIRNRCPNIKGATIGYDKCLYKYENENFFSIVDYQSAVTCDPGNAKEPAATFNGVRRDLLIHLAVGANQSELMYANGSRGLAGSEKLYGFAQCTRDLIFLDCLTCLDYAIMRVSSVCNGKRGGRNSGGSCILRYEMYQLLNN
ncbi:cysteine-rich repeat secretory protein 38-like [Corylus avellana]|uniref:cysteine-rich repeat secretory protein 38-like n=1 Tax=Corylus avellana TaxID=13451 RepID=UPI00286CFB58|nr:cysteine-rich repeat secretory protein 38-like [Corylus avellana]